MSGYHREALAHMRSDQPHKAPRDFDPECDLPPDGATVTFAGVRYRFDASKYPTGMWVDPDGRVGRPFSEGGKTLARIWAQL